MDERSRVRAMLELADAESASSPDGAELEATRPMRELARKLHASVDERAASLSALVASADDDAADHSRALQQMIERSEALLGLHAPSGDGEGGGPTATLSSVRQQHELLLHRCGAIALENSKRRQELQRRREAYMRREARLREALGERERELGKLRLSQAEDTRMVQLQRGASAIVARMHELEATASARVEQSEQELMAAFNARMVDVGMAVQRLVEREDERGEWAVKAQVLGKQLAWLTREAVALDAANASLRARHARLAREHEQMNDSLTAMAAELLQVRARAEAAEAAAARVTAFAAPTASPHAGTAAAATSANRELREARRQVEIERAHAATWRLAYEDLRRATAAGAATRT